MSRSYVILLVFILMGCFACEYDYEVKFPDEKKLVPISNFSPDGNFIVFLSTSNTVADAEDRVFFPRNAEIKLFENDRYVETLEFHDDFSNMVHYKSKMIPEANNKYSIEAILEHYDSIYSEDIIPAAIDIYKTLLSSVEHIPEGDFDHLVTTKIGMNIQIEDPLLEEKYFHLKAKRPEIDPYTGQYSGTYYDLEIEVSDLTHEKLTHEYGILFKGADLQDQANRFELVTPFLNDTLFEVQTPIFLELRHVTEDYYRFHKTMSAQNILSFQQNIISNQAVRIYNNIENGIGNFSAYNSTLDTMIWYD